MTACVGLIVVQASYKLDGDGKSRGVEGGILYRHEI